MTAPPAAPPPPGAAGGVPVREAVMRGDGRLAGAEVIDAHAHLGPWYNFRIPRPDADGMLRTMDYAGVHVAWIAADASIGPDFRLGNDLVADAVRRHPDRFRGYVTVNPHYPDECRDELARRYDAGWRLVKLHTGTHDHPADGPGYRRAWEFAQDRGMHLLSHAFPSPERLAALAAAYPDVTISLGHAASYPQPLPDYYAVCRAHPNVYLDLCRLDSVARAAGADGRRRGGRAGAVRLGHPLHRPAGPAGPGRLRPPARRRAAPGPRQQRPPPLAAHRRLTRPTPAGAGPTREMKGKQGMAGRRSTRAADIPGGGAPHVR